MATIDDLIPHIYHERQQEGSMLCAQHALNSLLQGPYFSAPDLSEIAHRLDALEDTYDEDRRGHESTNMDDTGFFSVQVLEEALQVWNLTLIRWRSEEMRPFQDRPQSQLAFILNQHQHWYTLRRFGPALTDAARDPGEGHWFNLNSFLARPEWVGKLYLGMFLQQAEEEGYSVFVVTQKDPEGPLALPRTEADEFATAIPEDTGAGRTRGQPAASHASIEGFEDEDMELQAALQASLAGAAPWEHHDPPYPAPVAAAARDPIFGSGTRTPVGRGQARYGVPVLEEPEDEDEDIEIEELAPPAVNRYAQLAPAPDADPLAASRARSQAYMEHVRRQQEAALRDNYQEEAALAEAGIRRRNTRAEEEEAELMRAIEESRALHEAVGGSGAQEDDAPAVPRASGHPPAFGGDRVYDDEDAELQAALRASLEMLPEGFQVPQSPPARAPSMPAAPPVAGAPISATVVPPHVPEDEDEEIETESEADVGAAAPEPQLSMEEIRRRRLARFGG
ncbi:Josephin-domain-containing protein [Phanerochaete sordida]|uniref:ubiquitinyl hydrolase 1 n=1 Tax=Phanerochaete sordida TaxID=48140 RepID=A0A9P3GCK2_9APHY|nr:Josephin-domain-containing protein [Phanerochaete sordida]